MWPFLSYVIPSQLYCIIDQLLATRDEGVAFSKKNESQEPLPLLYIEATVHKSSMEWENLQT